MPISIGSTLNQRYTIERLLGRGGMASVWLARDTRYGRVLALKTLDPELAGAVGADRFLREIRVTARLNHQAILPILDSGVFRTADAFDIPWYAMPYVEGESLRARLERERQLPIDEALRITRAVGLAVAAAHVENVVHRDIKPENILLSGDNVYVVDFGIAKALADTQAERLTSTGLVVGTPAYMSPEQTAGEPVDARSDQYSLASVFYEMIAGEPPFTGPSMAAIAARRMTESPRPMRTVRPGVAFEIEAATLRALERTPADRFRNVAEYLDVLRGDGSSGSRQPAARSKLLAIALMALVTASAWAAARYVHTRPPVRDPSLTADYQRGMREYDRRTPKANNEAIVIFRNLVRRDSSSAEAWNALAKAYIRAWIRGYVINDVPRDQIVSLANDAVDRSLALDSSVASAWSTLALVRRAVDPTDVAPALQAARRSVALDSTDGGAWQNLGTLHADVGDLDAAIAAYQRAVRVAPAYAEGLAFLAQGHYWRRNLDSAAVWTDSVVRLAPNYVFGRQLAGMVAIERNDFTRAEAALDAARRLSSDAEYLNAIANEAMLYATARNPGKARSLLGDAESLSRRLAPLPAHPILYLAQAYVRLGEPARALGLLRGYQPTRDLHFQLHLRCDAPFDALRTDPRFRALLVRESPPRGKGC